MWACMCSSADLHRPLEQADITIVYSLPEHQVVCEPILLQQVYWRQHTLKHLELKAHHTTTAQAAQAHMKGCTQTALLNMLHTAQH